MTSRLVETAWIGCKPSARPTIPARGRIHGFNTPVLAPKDARLNGGL